MKESGFKRNSIFPASDSQVYVSILCMKRKPELDRIRSDFFRRGVSLAKMGLRAGMLAARGAFKDDKLNQPMTDEFKAFFLKQLEGLTQELGELKGSLMKAGQMLSMYGEHFLPKEANEILKSLQFQSQPVAWSVMQKVLKKELGAEKLAELDIDPTPWAAASLGQVHRAKRHSDGQELAIKIQYPGVDKAIENDLKVLKAIFSLIGFIPKGPRFEQIFEEVRTMLYQEVNYELEAQFTEKFSALLREDSRFLVPSVVREFSSRRVLTTTFISGEPIDSPQALSLSQKRRDHIGAAFLDLYMRELLEFGFVQTDPHLGNYRIAIDPQGENDRLVVFDFGAVRSVPLDFLRSYHRVMKGAFYENTEELLKGGRGLGLVQEGDSLDLLKKYSELCILITEPFAVSSGVYDWGASDLPKRVAKKGTDIAFSIQLRAPPREIVFLDRKLGGTFVFLSVLKCQLNGRKLIEPLIANPPLLERS